MRARAAAWRAGLSPSATGHLAMLAFAAVVAGSFSLGATIANEIDPAALTAVRFAIALAVVAGLAAAQGGWRRAALAAPWRYLVLGCLYGGYFVLMFEGLKTAPPVSAAAVFTLVPAMTALFGWAILGQVPTARLAGALAIGGAGALWVIFRGDPAALVAFAVGRGEAIYFVGCIAHAVLTPLMRRLNRGEPAVSFTALMLVAGVIVVSAAGAPALVATDWGTLPARVWWVTAYLAIFASATSFVLLQVAAMRLPAAKVMAYTYLVPSFVIGWEVGLGNGAPAGVVAVGVALTALAVVLLLKDD